MEETATGVIERRAVLGKKATAFRNSVLLNNDCRGWRLGRRTLADPKVFDDIERLLLPRLLPGSATAVCRTQYDIITYKDGDIFAPNTDFLSVRMPSSGSVIQYFGLYCLSKKNKIQCQGGEAIVNGVAYNAARFDEAIACPAELLYEASLVTAGQKLVLKFDFLRIIVKKALLDHTEVVSVSTERIICANGIEKIVDRNLLERIPFFAMAFRFPRVEKDAIHLKGMDPSDFDALLEYLSGGCQCLRKSQELLEIMDALCMQEVAVAYDWNRFLAGAPVFVSEEAVTPFWEDRQNSVVPFVVVTAQTTDDSPTRILCAIAILVSGVGLPLITSKWALPIEDLFTKGTPGEVAERASEKLAIRASDEINEMNATASVAPVAVSSCDVKALSLRAPLLLAMLKQDLEYAATVSRWVKEYEYNKDGHYYDVLLDYETLQIGYRFGVFRTW